MNYLTDATVTKGKPGDFGTCLRVVGSHVEPWTNQEGRPLRPRRVDDLCGKPASRWLEGGTYGDGSDWWELALCGRCHSELVADEERALAKLDALLDSRPEEGEGAC